MTDTATIAVSGAVGFTGLTRASVFVQTPGTSIVFTIPNTFIMKGYIPSVMKADGTAAVNITACTVSGDTVTMTADAALDAGAEIVLFGTHGRRDFLSRTAENWASENPNIDGRP